MLSMANGLSSAPRVDLQARRLNAGLSRKGLALEAGVHHEVVRKLEEGEPVHPSSAKKVADWAGCTVVELLGQDKAAA